MTAGGSTLRVNVWSSPRNLSTALMYSWRQRADTTVVDEPLYGAYLAETGRQHPGFEEVIAAQDTNPSRVVEEVILGPYASPVVFFKQMAKHLIGADRAFLSECRNVLLTREPLDMLTSFQKGVPDTTLDDTGFVELVEILDWLEANGDDPIVIDSKRLLLDPPRVLGKLCERLGLEFDPAMLSWPKGPKPEDGVWAVHWYDSVRASTGWTPWRPKPDALAPELEPVLAEAMPLYAKLASRAL